MKTHIYLSLTLCTLLSQVFGQHREVRERVFIHPNSQVFVAGETLRYAAYTLSHTSGEVADISSILYVQLVGDKGPLWEQKIRLKNGRGSGEFFINSLVPTGRYQLLAYTRWMRNFEDYFQLPVTIINPFEAKVPPTVNDSLNQVSFYHPNGYLISGINNRVGFRIVFPEGNPGFKEGKLINTTGTVVQTFGSPKEGLGTFDFAPNYDESYRVLLEDSKGKITFHEFIPVKPTGYTIQVEKRLNDLILTPQVVGRSEEDLTLQIHFADLLWESIPAKANEALAFRHDALPPEIFQITLHQAGQQVFSRTIIPAWPQDTKVFLDGLKSTYAPRDSLKVRAQLPPGDYSLSVHQKNIGLDEWQISIEESRVLSELNNPLADRLQPPVLEGNPDLLSSVQSFKSKQSLTDTVSRLPEIRNELLEAVLKSTSGEPIAGQEVALSFPGQTFQFKTGFTDQNGKVLFHYQPMKDDRKAYLAVLRNPSPWQIELENKFATDFPAFDYRINDMDSLTVMEIKRRSINNQLMNTFVEVPIAVTDTAGSGGLQLTQWNFEYTLDDYQRFPDFKEYFIEYIIGAGIKAGGINIRKEFYRPEFQNPQLVLLDGVPVSPSRILEMDPYLIEKVKVMMNRVYLGPSVFDGVVSIETYTHDLAGYVPMSFQTFDYQGLLTGSKAFYGPPQQNSNTPDRRINLYWEPMLSWKGGWFDLNTVASDVTGVFEIRIEGITSEGTPMSIKEVFTVTSTDQ